MRTLDRYIIRSFLHSYLLCFLVMMGLRVVADPQMVQVSVFQSASRPIEKRLREHGLPEAH